MACQACGMVHHQWCWAQVAQCGSYECAPSRRELGQNPDAVLKISATDVAQTPPLSIPARRGFVVPPLLPPAPAKPTMSGLAIAAFVCALAGIPLFGLVTGLVAIVLGSLALGAIRTQNKKGLGFALVGVLLGLGDVAGWILLIALCFNFDGSRLRTTDFHADLSVLENPDPKINQSMRANVLIQTRGWWGGGIGSGVILQIKDQDCLIITNRHVVDLSFDGGAKEPDMAKLAQAKVEVLLVDQTARAGNVVWVAPGGIDLALVKIALPAREARAAKWELGRRINIGDPVFAVGNPHGLGWTHTQGAVSQFRTQATGSHSVRVIQTQTAINKGNSGGGLYDREGYLIGINTWAQDKRVSEGLNFTIALDILGQLRPDFLDLKFNSQDPD